MLLYRIAILPSILYKGVRPMEIREHRLSLHLPLAKDYVENYSSVAELFDYDPFSEDSSLLRYRQLQEQSLRCSREQLVEVLRGYNQQIQNHPHAMAQVERLQNPDAVVVIGGQQPGVLTGPLYTIHKVITLLSLAKQEESRLGVPVIPVFWIAGEDHDWDEVNHVFFANTENRIKKHTLNMRVKNKASISHIAYEPDEVKSFVDQFLDQQVRTEHTAELRAMLYREIDASQSYSHFFARLLVTLFGEDGLVLIDAADPSVRAIEGEMFRQLLKENRHISKRLLEASERVTQMGYTPQVESKLESAQLFVYQNGERLALEFDGDAYRLKGYAQSMDIEDLIDLTYTDPSKFSCNVVTRPLMQEYLFPVLAFIGGPGEISYWALYREIFHHLGLRLPIIIPRITMSLVERQVQRLEESYQLSFDDLIHHLDERKEAWLNSQDELNTTSRFEHLVEELRQLYQPLQQELASFDSQLLEISEKNLARMVDQVGYLERKTRNALEKRHQTVLLQFERAKQSLVPNGKPQERLLNPYSFINKYGFEWWATFKKLPYVVNGLHKEVRL